MCKHANRYTTTYPQIIDTPLSLCGTQYNLGNLHLGLHDDLTKVFLCIHTYSVVWYLDGGSYPLYHTSWLRSGTGDNGVGLIVDTHYFQRIL